MSWSGWPPDEPGFGHKTEAEKSYVDALELARERNREQADKIERLREALEKIGSAPAGSIGLQAIARAALQERKDG